MTEPPWKKAMSDRPAPDLLALHQQIAELQEEVARRRDAEERERRARELADAANRAKDSALIQFSHELRTSLQATVGWAHLLRATPKDAERVRSGADAIERNARVQTRLIENLLKASWIGAGTTPLASRPVYLAPLVRQAVEEVRPLAERREIDLLVEANSHGGTVRGDHERLQQILQTVLSNVVKSTPSGGRIEISLSRDDVRAEIRIVDTAAGFDPAGVDDIFESSRSLDADAGAGAQALAHGLGVARSLAERHGGSLDVTSAGRGQGATVTLRLPLLPLGLEELTADAPIESAHSCDGLRILVVDDEDEARMLVAELLSSHGAVVNVAPSALVAMAALSKARYDVLVSDLVMPLDDGFSLIDQVRTEGGLNQYLPAVALTAYASDEMRDRALKAGFAAYVTMPVRPAALVNIIAAVAGGTHS